MFIMMCDSHLFSSSQSSPYMVQRKENLKDIIKKLLGADDCNTISYKNHLSAKLCIHS